MSGRTTSQELLAQAAAEKASAGEIPLIESYLLQYNEANNQYTLGVPPVFPRNTAFGKRDVAGCYVDFERGMIVYDLQEGTEYDRD